MQVEAARPRRTWTISWHQTRNTSARATQIEGCSRRQRGVAQAEAETSKMGGVREAAAEGLSARALTLKVCAAVETSSSLHP